jgi:predicted phosphodiesterase
MKKPNPIIYKYLENFPNTAHLTLAKKIYKEHPAKFTNIEHIRTLIRYYRGSSGDEGREDAKKHIDYLAKLKEELPKGETEKVEPYYLPKDRKKVLVISDIHLPYHDDKALFAALEYGLKEEVDTIYINGDLLDFALISKHENTTTKHSVKYELDCAKVFLKGLREMFPKALIIYKYGNHDLRFDKWIRLKAPELLDIEHINLAEILCLNELSIIQLDNLQWAYMWDIAVLHGHELPMKSGGINPARAARLKINRPLIIGHFHRQSKDAGMILGKPYYYAYSSGCLCDLSPSYMPINDWVHGFILIDQGQVYQKEVIDGRVI